MKRWLKLSQLAQTEQVRRSGAGYTITEVMIVLAVTTALFAAMVLSFNGRQARVEFNQAVRNYESRLQTVISDVSKGFYTSGFECSIDGSSFPVVSGSTQQAGTNDDCIFLGKIVATGTDSTSILTVLGRRLGTDGSEIKTLDDANANPMPDVLTNEKIDHAYGLRVDAVEAIGLPPSSVGAFGFITQLSGGTASSGGGGARSIYLYGIRTTTPSSSLDSVIGRIRAKLLEPLDQGLVICLRGGNDQRARITLGANNSQTGIVTEIDTPSGGPCP